MSATVYFGNHLDSATIFVRIDGNMLYNGARSGEAISEQLSLGSTIEIWTNLPDDPYWGQYCLRAYTYEKGFEIEYTTRYDNHIFLTVTEMGNTPSKGYFYITVSSGARNGASVDKYIDIYANSGEPIFLEGVQLSESAFTTDGVVTDPGYGTFYIKPAEGPYYTGDPNSPNIPTVTGTGDSFTVLGVTFNQDGIGDLSYTTRFIYVANLNNPALIPVSHAADLEQVANQRLWEFAAGTPDAVVAHASKHAHYRQTAHIMNGFINPPNQYTGSSYRGMESTPIPNFVYDGDGYVIKDLRLRGYIGVEPN